MEEPPKKTSRPQSITEDIIKYLQAQEHLTDEEEGCGMQDYSCDPDIVNAILKEILQFIGNRAELFDNFAEKLKNHNQYQLFNLRKRIPDFEIDEDMYKKLTFRETLVISTFKDATKPFSPKVVGGLCLDIQAAKGDCPIQKNNVCFEKMLIKFIMEKVKTLNKIVKKKSCKGNVPRPSAVSSSPGIDNPSEDDMPEKTVRDFITTIEPSYEQLFSKFLVHLSSKLDVDGCTAGSHITAWVDRNLHTLEEKRKEYIKLEQGRDEQSLYCAMQPKSYYMKHENTLEGTIEKRYYTMRRTKDLICEGANFILMRYLAISKYIGTFEMSTVYINGDLCRNVYACLGPESGMVNDKKLDLCTINRTIIEECGITHKCVTVLTLHGQIVKQEWDNCEYILQLNPFAQISNTKPHGNERLLLHKVWEKDMQMFSTFLDYKATSAKRLKSYLSDHQEFRDMLADYVQATVMMKPEDVLDFTVEHFTQYYNQDQSKRNSLGTEMYGSDDNENDRLPI